MTTEERTMEREQNRPAERCDRRRLLKLAPGVLAAGACLGIEEPGGGAAPAFAEGAEGAEGAGEPLVLYQNETTWEEVAGKDGPGRELDGLGLIAKGEKQVRFRGKSYPVEREGLYRFMALPVSLRNLISLRDGRSLVPLLTAFSSLQVHGNRHDGESVEALIARALREPWVAITCGNIARLLSAVLEGEGYKTRMVYVVTGEKRNHYDDGHVLFEVFWPEAKKWVLVDADMGLLFKDRGASPAAYLGAQEFAARVKEGRRPEFVPLGQKAAVLDPFFLGPGGYNYALEFRWRWATADGQWRWYRRVFQQVQIAG
jgi:hypothetical protein